MNDAEMGDAPRPHPDRPAGLATGGTEVVLSHVQVAPLLAARAKGLASMRTSFDLGRSQVEAGLSEAGVVSPGGVIAWSALELVAGAETKCFRLTDGDLDEIRVFSETTGWVRSLFPTAGAPTTLVSGLTMHRIKDTDPHCDTLAKIRAASPLGDAALDTATGLGYTAIEAAKLARRVVTVEIDPAALAIAAQNPWSQDLFDNPRIESIIGDLVEVALTLPDGGFSCILHDPPALALAGELYSTELYREFWRLLRPRGRLFHYIGDPTSRSGARTTASVIRRLETVGFGSVGRRPEAFGVVATKSR